jgi:hypothetical protein
MRSLNSTMINPTIFIIFNMIIVIVLIVCNKLFAFGETILLIKFFLGILLVFGIGIMIGKLLHIDRHLK